MHVDLRDFLYRFLGVVGLSLVPVVLVAFLSMPMSLGRHPGESPDPSAPPLHMT